MIDCKHTKFKVDNDKTKGEQMPGNSPLPRNSEFSQTAKAARAQAEQWRSSTPLAVKSIPMDAASKQSRSPKPDEKK
ncbi:hypothetical protein ACQKH5_17585 [Hyphomonas sp. NPDC076900]|uniref:hypothetical protein n=1 Tax=unclassified Hyphomonas TaxID=2630699 RepID=UPI003D08EDFE